MRTSLGLVEILSIKCDVCGYKHTSENIIEPSEYGPEEIIIRIDSEKDLKTYILKSRFAEVIFQELGIEIYPGPASSDEIYPVEGLLEKYIERIEAMCFETEDPEKCFESTNYLRRVVNGEEKLTIIIRDPSRISRILATPIL